MASSWSTLWARKSSTELENSRRVQPPLHAYPVATSASMVYGTKFMVPLVRDTREPIPSTSLELHRTSAELEVASLCIFHSPWQLKALPLSHHTTSAEVSAQMGARPKAAVSLQG